MKKILSLLVIALILALTLSSCTFIKGAFFKYEVRFDLNGGLAGEGFTESVTVKHGKTTSMPTPTRDNYTFEGWYADGELYTSTTPITKDVVLKAEWSFNETYKITYNTNGRGENIPADFVKLGTLPKIPTAPQVEGYVFAGWYLDEALTERYYFDYALDADTTLHANFYDTQLGEYIVISTFEQLAAIKDDPAAKYLLACDINCHGEAITPINEFTGELHGNGYKIYDFTISDTNNISGFIRTNKGTIKDLTFKDFVMDVLANSAADKNYGSICGVNNGIIENCRAIDGTMKIDTVTSGKNDATYYVYIGGLVGHNKGKVISSESQTYMNIIAVSSGVGSYNKNYVYANIDVGGIIGVNAKDSSVDSCENHSDIKVVTDAVSYASPAMNGYLWTIVDSSVMVGGIAGYNLGNIDRSTNDGDIDVKIEHVHHVSNSQHNENEVLRIYSGSAVGINKGKIYNCYTTGDITINGDDKICIIGAFVGYNNLVSGYSAMINKCFSMSSITVNSIPTNCGYFAGKTTGTEKYCYYLDTVTINQKTVVDDVETLVALEPTTKVGEAKTIEELLSVDFILNTLNFDRMEWFIKDGELPKLR